VHDLNGVQAAVSGPAKIKLMCQIYSLIISGTYTECIKKTEQIWICSQFRKTAISIQFFYVYSIFGYL
jgi:hypothetical protein